MKRTRSQKGQTLIEVVAGIGLLVIVVTALIGLGVIAMKTASSARNRTVAVKLAGEEMELVRAYRDNVGFADLEDLRVGQCDTETCYTDGSVIVLNDYESLTVSGTEFRRYFNLATTGVSGKIRVTAYVLWTESSGTKTTSVTSFLTDWR